MPATYVVLPPLSRPSGGLAVLHHLAAHLAAAELEVRFVSREEGRWSPDFSAQVEDTPWALAAPQPGDVWLCPEGWVNLLAPGLRAGARCVVYVQNWAYLFSALPAGVTWDRLDVEFLAVSRPVAWHIREATGQEAPVLPPGIDLELFRPPAHKPAGPVRAAFMPRKNKAQADLVRDLLAARRARGLGPDLEWVEISGQDAPGVAEILRSCHLFLATGFPEGCPLPPLEAMACGCLPVGFSGFGGMHYMRQADPDLPGALRCWLSAEGFPEHGGNGLWVADADAPAAALALERAAGWLDPASPGRHRYLAALRAGQATAAAYGLEAQARAAVELWTTRYLSA